MDDFRFFLDSGGKVLLVIMGLILVLIYFANRNTYDYDPETEDYTRLTSFSKSSFFNGVWMTLASFAILYLLQAMPALGRFYQVRTDAQKGVICFERFLAKDICVRNDQIDSIYFDIYEYNTRRSQGNKTYSLEVELRDGRDLICAKTSLMDEYKHLKPFYDFIEKAHENIASCGDYAVYNLFDGREGN